MTEKVNGGMREKKEGEALLAQEKKQKSENPCYRVSLLMPYNTESCRNLLKPVSLLTRFFLRLPKSINIIETMNSSFLNSLSSSKKLRIITSSPLYHSLLMTQILARPPAPTHQLYTILSNISYYSCKVNPIFISRFSSIFIFITHCEPFITNRHFYEE